MSIKYIALYSNKVGICFLTRVFSLLKQNKLENK